MTDDPTCKGEFMSATPKHDCNVCTIAIECYQLWKSRNQVDVKPISPVCTLNEKCKECQE